MEADLVERAFRDRAKPGGDFDAEHIGAERLAPARTLPGADCKHSRQHARGRMDDAAAMGIVEVEAMNQNAVDQRRVAQWQPRRDADDREVTGAGKPGNCRHGPMRKIIGRGGKRDADRVENKMFGARVTAAGIRSVGTHRRTVQGLRK